MGFESKEEVADDKSCLGKIEGSRVQTLLYACGTSPYQIIAVMCRPHQLNAASQETYFRKLSGLRSGGEPHRDRVPGHWVEGDFPFQHKLSKLSTIETYPKPTRSQPEAHLPQRPWLTRRQIVVACPYRERPFPQVSYRVAEDSKIGSYVTSVRGKDRHGRAS